MRLFIFILLIMAVSCEEMTTGIVFSDPNTFRDERDNNLYKTVDIANNTWLAENFRYIPDSGYYQSSDNVLYDVYAAVECCPDGWHLPTLSEWELLIEDVGSEYAELNRRGLNLSFTGWFQTEYIGQYSRGAWWTSTKQSDSHGGYTWIFYISDRSPDILLMNFNNGKMACVRYIKDK